MSAACQTNPLQQLIAKGDQVHTRSFASSFSHESSRQQQQQQQQHVSAEHFFLNNDSPHLNIGNRFLQVQQSTQLAPSESRGSNVDNSWLNQFSSMKVEDPSEFSKEYKSLYANYESQQQRSPMSATLQRTMYHQPMNSYFNVAERSALQTRSDNAVTDTYFNTEFDTLERELEESPEDCVGDLSRRSSNSRTTTYNLDNEQLEFQQIANSIVDSCSVSNSPSPVSSKLSGSKFMGLMRGISDGSITLKKRNDHDDENQRATEFHSPITGELVGNEYFPVFDNVHDII